MPHSLQKIWDQAVHQMSDIAILFEVVKRRFRFLDANQAAYQAGFKEERNGKFVEDVLPPNYAERINWMLSQAYITRKPFRYEEGLPTSFGKFIGEIVITPLLNEEGDCTHLLGLGRDITELKARETELSHTKSFLDSVLASATDGILVTNTNYIITRINTGFTMLFGWNENEATGKHIGELGLIPPGYEEELQNIATSLTQGINIPSHRTVRTKKDGKRIHVSASYSPIKGENGIIQGYLVIYRDISGDIEKELQLSESKERYQSLMLHHPDAVYEFDLHGRYTGGNASFETMTGYTISELVNTSFVPLVTNEKKAFTVEQFQAATKGETRNYETSIYHKSGEVIELEVTNVPIIVNGQIKGVFGIAKNITEQKRLQHELVTTKETLESFFTHTIDAIDIVNLERKVMDVNPAFERMFGYSKDEIIGQDIELILPEGQKSSNSMFRSVISGDIVHGLEGVRRRKDGIHLDVSLSLSPIRDEEGNVISVAAITRDISGRKRAERQIQESEEKYRLIAEHMTDLIAVLTPDWRILYASPSHQTVGGGNFRAGDHFPIHRFHEDDRTHVLDTFRKAATSQKQEHIEFRIQHFQGHYIWLDTKLTPVANEEGDLLHILCISRDITERKQYQEELEKMAFYDYLTGAANRRLFMDRLQYTMDRAERNHESFAILSLDFDRFKWVNDTLGHDVGDELLIQFVRRIQSCIRRVDTLSRLGGDEFAILLPGNSTAKEAEQIAKRIVDALQEPWNIGTHRFVSTSSIGISMYPACGHDISSLMKHADLALYQAKQAGRNTYSFCFETEKHQPRSFPTWEAEIERALLQHEFYLVFQPIFELASRRIVSLEALIRWQHPTRGLILPNEFITQAEELNLIERITKWVLEEAGKQVMVWKSQYNLSIPVAVNISASHFEKGALARDIVSVARQIGISPSSYILEITERTMIQDLPSTLNTLQELKELGVRIAIDDFGTGYSSLSYLLKLNVDFLKLDKAFIQELTKDKNASIVNHIIALAHQLKLHVVAEGIETEKQCMLLDQYGCDIGQGYYFSKPLTSDQLERVFFSHP